VNLLMMMSANLVGFVMGLDGMKHWAKELITTGSGEPSLTLMYRSVMQGLTCIRIDIPRIRLCLLVHCCTGHV
jgi:hypothetical protein